MGLLRSRVLRESKGVAGASFTTSSWTPGALRPGANFWVALISSVAATAPNVPSVTGNGATWTSAISQTVGNTRACIFTTNSASAAAGTTVDFGAQSQSDIAIEIHEYSGAAVNNIVRQAVSNSVTAATSISKAMADFVTGDDRGLGIIHVVSTTNPTIVAGDGWGLTNSTLVIASALALNGMAVGFPPGIVSASWTGAHDAAIAAIEVLAGRTQGQPQVVNRNAIHRASRW